MWFEQNELCAATEIPTEPSTRESSSIAVAYSTYPRPAPPYSSGNKTPVNPSSPSFGSSSIGKCCASSHSITYGAISASANSRTLIFICNCSSVSSKCIGSEQLSTNKRQAWRLSRCYLELDNCNSRAWRTHSARDGFEPWRRFSCCTFPF